MHLGDKTNKSNYMAGVVRVEANLPGHPSVRGQFLLEMLNKKLIDLENEYQRDGAQHQQLCHSIANIKIKSVKEITFLRQLSLHSEILIFQFLPKKFRSR